MYATWPIQIDNLLHYFTAVFLLGALLPRLLFTRVSGDRLEGLWGGYIKIVAFLIAVGYALAAARLFEMISFLVAFILTGARFYMKRKKEAGAGGSGNYEVQTRFYNLIDGQWRLAPAVISWASARMEEVRSGLRSSMRTSAPVRIVLLLTVIFISAYLRFYDAVTTSPPAMPGGYEALASMKAVGGQQLFHSGVVPQGFPIFMAVLSKFASTDLLFVLKYTGPLNGALITASLYFVVARLTGQFSAGLVSAVLYGWLGQDLSPAGWERQTAANAQEFAIVFLLPAFYFTFRYLNGSGSRSGSGSGRSPHSLLLAGLSFGIMGLAHPLVLAYGAVGALILTAVFLPAGRQGQWQACRSVAAAVAASAAIAALPLGLGLLAGKPLHEAVVTAGEPVSGLAGPAGGLGVLSASFAIGGTWHMAVRLLARRERLYTAANLAVCILLPLGILLAAMPAPVVTAKLQQESGVDQYLRISRSFLPKTWTVVSQESYYAVLGNGGYHMYAGKLLDIYDPGQPYLTRWGEEEPDPEVPLDVFIFLDKEKGLPELRKWLERHGASQGDMALYYEDEALEIYRIHREMTAEERNKLLWGG